MFNIKEIRKSILVALWIMVLTFPIMVIRVNTIANTIEWRWNNLIFVGVFALVISHVWRFLLEKQPLRSRRRVKGNADTRSIATTGVKAAVAGAAVAGVGEPRPTFFERMGVSREILAKKSVRLPSYGGLILIALIYPLFASLYQTSIMITALQFVILALGLNIAIGLGGLLHLGIAAFYAVGAYTYALLNLHFGIGFWIALPAGAALAAILGVVLGVAVLRLGGDYLGIVTLGFAEIVRIILENTVGLTNGPRGIPGVDRPRLFDIKLNLSQATDYTYYIAFGLTVLTIFVVYRLENSRIGRAWEATREDEIAAESMGVNLIRSKLRAFAMSALFAGVAGVLFAAKTTFVSPKSFTLIESITVLLAIVLGGIGSIPGVIVGALIVTLLPEVLREFSQYRMLIFGGLLVVMMVFRPGGIIPKRRKAYRLEIEKEPLPVETD